MIKKIERKQQITCISMIDDDKDGKFLKLLVQNYFFKC